MSNPYLSAAYQELQTEVERLRKEAAERARRDRQDFHQELSALRRETARAEAAEKALERIALYRPTQIQKTDVMNEYRTLANDALAKYRGTA
jgi:hypothetical protein